MQVGYYRSYLRTHFYALQHLLTMSSTNTLLLTALKDVEQHCNQWKAVVKLNMIAYCDNKKVFSETPQVVDIFGLLHPNMKSNSIRWFFPDYSRPSHNFNHIIEHIKMSSHHAGTRLVVRKKTDDSICE